MAKKISAALRDKLLQAKSEMGGSGLIISNKNLTKVRLRVLPCGDDIPGKPYYSLYSPALNKGVASPRTFGLPCPVLDAYDNIKRTGSKDEREHAKNVISPQTEYWMAVLDRDDMGTPQSPNVRILCAKKTVFQAVINRMTDEDDGEDVTDPTDGRDMRVRKVQGEQNPWKVTWLDRSPLAEDEDDTEAILEAVEGFNVEEKFFKINVAKLQEFYDALTGESIPNEYLETLLADEDHCYWPDDQDRPSVKVSKKKSKKSKKPVEDDDEIEDDEDEGEDDEGEEIDTIEVGAKVTFVDEDEGEIEGTLTEIDEDGNYLVDDGEAEWTVDPATTAIEAVEEEGDEEEGDEEAEPEEDDEGDEEEEPEEDDEEEEEEPKPKAKKKKPTAKKAKKKKAPAKKAPAKKKAGKASSKLRSRLNKSKKK